MFLFCVTKGIFYGKYKFLDQGGWSGDCCIFTLLLDTVIVLKNGRRKTSRASLLHCQSQLKRHRRYFCQLYRSPWKKKEKMLYIFHITCCKVLICEALIKTLLNDLWIAISHSAFLLFYTFLWVTIAAINFVCILLTNQLLLKTVHRINAYRYGVPGKLFSAHNRKSNLMFEFFARPWRRIRDIPSW